MKTFQEMTVSEKKMFMKFESDIEDYANEYGVEGVLLALIKMQSYSESEADAEGGESRAIHHANLGQILFDAMNDIIDANTNYYKRLGF